MQRNFDIHVPPYCQEEHFLRGQPFSDGSGQIVNAVLSQIWQQQHMYNVHLQDFFYQEYYTPRADDVARRMRIHLEHFESQGWVLRRDAAASEYSVSEKGKAVLVFFAAQTRGVLAAYRALFEGLAEIDGEIRRNDIYRRAKEKFENARLLGEPAGVESANETTLSNALELLESRGVLQRLPAEGKRSARDPAFAFGEHGRDLAGLTQRLAIALADR